MIFPLLRFRLRLTASAALLLVVQTETHAQPQEPPVSMIAGSLCLLKIPNSTPGRTYFMQWSLDMVSWKYLAWTDLGAGNEIGTLVSLSGAPRKYFRLQYSDVVSTDFDNDGISNINEVMNGTITSPFDPDTDNDGIPDGVDPNKLEPDDSRPGVYTLEWQRFEEASLQPVGWSSSQTGAVQPNYYKTITVTATRRESASTSTPTASDTFEGLNLSITRNRLEPATFSGTLPDYREETTYSYAAGQLFNSAYIQAPPPVGTWSTGDPGAIASRSKLSGTADRYTYDWTYAAPQNDLQLPIGNFGQVFVPHLAVGTLHQWQHSASSTPKGKDYTTSAAPILLPNVNYFPENGQPAANLNWSSASSATGLKEISATNQVASEWTLSNRLTYSLVRSELEALRNNIKSELVNSNGNTYLPASAYYVQGVTGAVGHQLYQFYFRKVPGLGGSGPTTLLWTETFTAQDNPDTPANEASAPVTRTRAITLLPNAAQSPIYTLDYRISPYTVLPGEPNAPQADGSTEVGTLFQPCIAVDYNRNGTAADDFGDRTLADQGAYETLNGKENQGAFRQTGALIFANYSKDEDRTGGGKPVGDAIRYYHDGWNPTFTDEDYTIRTGEDKLPTDAGTTQRADTNYVRTNLKLPDIYPLQISKMGRLPSHYRVFLRVRSPEEKKAFHLYKKIAVGQNAIWGGGIGSTATPPVAPYSATDEVDITRWVNPAAPDYEETREDLLDATGQLITALAERDYVFGIEGVLYKGQEIGTFQQPAQFKGYADIRMEFRAPGAGASTIPALAGHVRVTFVRKPAFPGAYGYGRWALGGSRGEVFTVDSLNDSTEGPGSINGLYLLNGTLRQAFEFRNYDHNDRLIPRTVVFRKSGILNLTTLNGQGKPDLAVARSEVKLRGLLTVAGQSAPSGGILLKNGGLHISGYRGITANVNLYKRANDVIFRYTRFRPFSQGVAIGETPVDDAVRIENASDVIMDHVSASWGKDGTMDLVTTPLAVHDSPDQSVTIQWSLIAESLLNHSKASLHTGKYGSRYSSHHNLYTNHEERMPEIGNWIDAVNAPAPMKDTEGEIVDVRNNVFYNWGLKM